MAEVMSGPVRIRFTLNGRAVEGEAEPRMQLADFLRHVIGARGTHVGCEHGVCGACTVIVDDRPARACLMFAVQVEGADVRTVEGLAQDGRLSALQQAFMRHHALQCGFCTPGILLSATRYLKDNPRPSEAQIREMLSGHICRCTGYQGIVDAILEVAGSGATRPLPDSKGSE
jgi:2-furoyl-CoA dehydrogenase 2Fe-2S iron sulfur subunit